MANFPCDSVINSLSSDDFLQTDLENPASKSPKSLLQAPESVAFNEENDHHRYDDLSPGGLAVAASLCTCAPRRRTETPEQAALRRQRDRERKRQLRLQESSLETAIRRQKDALNKMKQRMMESPEQTAQRRAKDRDRARQARRSETGEQAALRREKNRLRKRELRRNLSVGDALQKLLNANLDVTSESTTSKKKENSSPS